MKNTGIIKSYNGECGIILDDDSNNEYQFYANGLIDVIDIGDDVEFELNADGFAVNIIYQMEL